MDASLLFYSLLMLLAACVCGHMAGAGDHASRLRGLWRLSMKNSKTKGKDVPHHPVREMAEQQLLYCRVGIGYHLQILSNGFVGGVHEPTEHSFLKLFAMKRGVVGIRGVRSNLYLCMSEEGIAYGAKQFTDDCLFKENMEENHYNTYSSLAHPGIYLALSHKGEVKRGTSVSRHQPFTHFLPRRASITDIQAKG